MESIPRCVWMQPYPTHFVRINHVNTDKYLWIGGQDGRLYMFTIDEHVGPTGTKYSVSLFKKKFVSAKKAITNLQIDPPHKKLFALVDNTVCVYDMTTLLHLEVGTFQIRSVTM